jgi:hypothetical protein
MTAEIVEKRHIRGHPQNSIAIHGVLNQDLGQLVPVS